MLILRTLGRALILAALVLFGYDVWRWWTDEAEDARFAFQSIAEIWVEIDANSLVGLGSLFQNQWFPDNPDLFTDWVVPVLGWPAVVPLAVLGLMVTMLFRRRQRRR